MKSLELAKQLVSLYYSSKGISSITGNFLYKTLDNLPPFAARLSASANRNVRPSISRKSTGGSSNSLYDGLFLILSGIKPF